MWRPLGATRKTARGGTVSRTSSGIGSWLNRLLFLDPTLGVLLVLLLVATGLFGYQGMIKEALPDLSIPMATIHTHWHGSSQTVVEKEVTDKIERELRDLDHLKKYASGSLFSNSMIMVELDAQAPLQESLSQLRERVDKAAGELPTDAKKPVVTQESIRGMPIATYVLYGNVSNDQINRAAKRLKKRLQRIPGITRVEEFGNRKRYVRVQVLPERLRAYGISPVEIASLIDARNADFPLGVYEGREQPLNLTSETAIHDIEQLADLPVKRSDSGRVIRLRDLARVEKAPYRAQTETWFSLDGSEYTRGVALSIKKGEGKDTSELVARATELMEQAARESDWPAGLKYNLVYSDAQVIQQELDKTLVSGWQSVVAVFLVLFFLLTWREAAVAALSIPITFLGSIVALWLLGYTFNVMVIIGMVVALGLLVDDFILMMEGMHNGLTIKRLSFGESALRTIRQFAVPSLAGTITTILIFVPLANIGGLDGKFIRAIPVTAAVCLIVSFLVSIFVSVPLSRFLLARKPRQDTALIDRVTLRAEEALSAWLQRRVTGRRRDACKWLGWGALVVGIGFSLAAMLPVTLYPLSDGRNLGITVELPVDYKLEEAREVAQRLGKALKDKSYLSSTLMVVGERDFVYEGSAEDRLSVSTAPNLIGFTVLYKPKKDRDLLAYQYVPRLRHELHGLLADVPGYRLLITSETGASSNEDPLQINISGSDMERLQEISRQVQQRLRLLDGLSDVRDNLGQGRVEATVKPRREMLDRYGLTERDFNAQLSLYLGDTKLAKLRSDDMDTDLDIRFEAYWPSKAGKLGGPESWAEWQSIRIKTARGEWVPVRLLADLHLTQVPLTVSHKNGRRNVTIMGTSFTLTFGEMHALVDPVLRELKEEWPAGYEYRWAGELELAEETYGNAGQAFVLAALAVFAVLVLQFRSFPQPAIILITVIFGITGVFFGFTLMAYPLSFPAVIGMIALAGINVNDGIVLVDTMNRHHRSGMSLTEAAARGAADRFRPIVSTTLTTLVGLMPLAIADESWRPLCAAIIFGEILSTGAAMAVMPALFRVLTQRAACHCPATSGRAVHLEAPHG